MDTLVALLLPILPTAIRHKIMMRFCIENYAVNDYNVRHRTGGTVSSPQEYIISTFLNSLGEKPHILDLGCGNAALYDRFMAERNCRITGVDISPRQLQSARHILPEHEFILCDFVKYKPVCQFDGITSFFSLYNLPRKLHKKVLRNCYKWLKDDGHMLINVRVEEVGDTDYWKDWCGAPLVFSYYSSDKFIKLAESVGFHVSKFDITHNTEYVWLILSKDDKLPRII